MIRTFVDFIGRYSHRALTDGYSKSVSMIEAQAATLSNSAFISGLVREEDLQAYRRDGAICIRGALTGSEVEALRRATDDVLRARIARGEAGAEGNEAADRPAFHNLLRVADDQPAFAHALYEGAAPKVARDLMQSRKVIVFGDTLLVKQPGSAAPTPWHHDMPYWAVRGEQVCSVWIALDDVTRDSGGMEYVAGSHRWNRWFRPRFFNGRQSDDPRFEIAPDIDAERDRYAIISWDMRPGDMLVHHGMTLHGAGANILACDRRAYAPRYVGDAAWWDPAFNSGRNPAAGVLAFGEPLDAHGVHRVAVDLTTGGGDTRP